MKGNIEIQAVWNLERYRHDALVAKQQKTNIIPMAMLNDALAVLLKSGTQKTAWYIAPFQTDTTPALGTTYATPVFTEATLYDETTRPAFTPATPAAGVITSVASKASFTWSTGGLSIYGGALVGGGTAATTKGDTAGGGIIFSAAKFPAPDTPDAADVSKIWLEITLANA